MSISLTTPVGLAQDAVTSPTATAGNSIPIERTVQDVQLKEEALRGALVDKAGNGVEDAPVVIGQKGKLIKELRTDSEGRWQLANVEPGVYQVISHGSAAVYRVWSAENAPKNAKAGIIHQVDPEVARGGGPNPLLNALTNPILIALLIAAAIAIPLALDDDDDDAS